MYEADSYILCKGKNTEKMNDMKGFGKFILEQFVGIIPSYFR